MIELLEALAAIGLPADEVRRIIEYYRGDDDGLRQYVAYMQALMGHS